MELETSPLMEEVDKIIKDGPKKVFYKWEVEFSVREPNPIKISDAEYDVLFTPEEEKEKIYKPLKILNLDYFRDYEEGFSDENTLRCSIPLGLWLKVLYPYRDYLKATVIRTPIKEETEEEDKDAEKESEVYACLPKITQENSGEGKTIDKFTRFELDLKGILDIDFQLFDFSTEKLRTVTVGGIYRRVVPEDVVKGVIYKESKKVELEDGPAIESLDIVKATNKEQREHIMLPQGLPISDVAGFVQTHCGGLYNAGVGQYLQNKAWYIYPLYDTTRFDEEQKTLTIIKVPQTRYNDIPRTYRLDGDKLFVLGTSNSEFRDATEVRYLTEGNGVRFADSRKFFDELVETKDNKAIAHRGKLNHEFVADEREKRNNVLLSKDPINSNPFVEYSKLARKKGNIYSFAWENCDLSLVHPGMLCKILYIKSDEIIELHGVLLKAQLSVQLQGQAITSKSHKAMGALSIFANFPEEEK